MTITSEDAKKIAKLARLAVTEDECAKIGPDLSNILSWIEQLNEVNTDNVEPLSSVSDVTLPMREDVVSDGDCREDVLANAPEILEGYFVVPKVVE